MVGKSDVYSVEVLVPHPCPDQDTALSRESQAPLILGTDFVRNQCSSLQESGFQEPDVPQHGLPPPRACATPRTATPVKGQTSGRGHSDCTEKETSEKGHSDCTRRIRPPWGDEKALLIYQWNKTGPSCFISCSFLQLCQPFELPKQHTS
jgi:hypothetical protein